MATSNQTQTNPFSDLSDAQIAEYSSALIQQNNEAFSRLARGNDTLSKLINDPEFEAIRRQRPFQMAAIPLNPIRDRKEAQTFANQIKALKHINANIDLTPCKTAIIRRDYMRVEPIMRSVVRPLTNPYLLNNTAAWINNLLPEEETLHRFRVGTKIDRDCDQLRAMIKIFVTAPQRPFPGDKLYREADDPYCWTLDRFRVCLKGILRPEFTTWLNYRGRTAGQASRIYQLVWEFFRKRELLGLELVTLGVEFEKQDEDGNAEVTSTGDGGARQRVEVAQVGDVGGIQGGTAPETIERGSAEEDARGNGHSANVYDAGRPDRDREGTEDTGADEFHDARETPGHDIGSNDGQTTSTGPQDHSPVGETASELQGIRTEEEADEGGDEGGPRSPGDVLAEGLVSEAQQPTSGNPSTSRRNKRGHATESHEEEAPEPTAVRKRLRSGRTL